MEKPNYINPNPRKISPEELKRIIHEIHEEQEIRRAEMWAATQKELHHGAFVCAPGWVIKALSKRK